MKKTLDLSLSPKQASDNESLKNIISKEIGIHQNSQFNYYILKKSIDARKANIKVNLKIDVHVDQPLPPTSKITDQLPFVQNKQNIIVIGAGPAGLFASIELIKQGFKPILLERGKNIHERKKDIAFINRNQGIISESNYCFGEGGAGTFSDGKLYTRSNKRGNIQEMLQILYNHGANENILYEAHPHIGTDKLPLIIENIRTTILNHGGEIYFNTKVEDFIIKNKEIKGVITHNNTKIEGKAVILATGHSARDIYQWFKNNKYTIEPKPFAVGVRLEHPQELINNIQYHHSPDIPYLPTAAYSIVKQIDNRGVFSFCMCPGGTIVPASTGTEEVVVNGMSNSNRNSPYANAGLVVQINPEDLIKKYGDNPLQFLLFQKEIEHNAWIKGNNILTAPAQRMADFVANKSSSQLNKTTYHPGLNSVNIRDVLPSFVTNRLAKAFVLWGKSMNGFLTNEAQLIGVESRTSSPIRITRDKETLEHIDIINLYPCGEGAGYAGGILSSAMDGVRIAQKIGEKFGNSIQ